MADCMRFSLIFMYLFMHLSFALGVAGCGQKGPLYLRDNPPPGVKPLKPAPPKPVPYPEETK